LQEDLNHLVGHDRLLPQGEMEVNEPSKDQEDSQPGR
jgi:hypothetical protein